jgi:segregation and condensation protein B
MSETNTKKNKKKNPAPTPSVAFVEDPFGIQTADIREAQDSQDAIDEGLTDEDLAAAAVDEHADRATHDGETAETAESLQRLAETIAKQVAEDEATQEALVASSEDATSPAAELAKQIAEDEALALQLAQENADAEAALAVDPELLAALPKTPLELEDGKLDLAEMESCIEALLFISDKPITLNKLQEHLGPEFDKQIFKDALAGLQARYQANHHGIEVVEVGGGFQFRTRPGRAALARKLAKVQTQRLSSGAMETLAILAYRQPAMKEEVDKVRGVDSSYFIRGLLDRRLIKISGRSELPGRPLLYSTTDEFLQIFGLASLDAMPPLQELESMVPASQAKTGDEDPRVKQMRKLVGEMNADTSTTLNYDPKEDEKILAEIRERVQSIPTSTASLDEQKAAEKAAKLGKTLEPAETLFEAVAVEEAAAETLAESETPEETQLDAAAEAAHDADHGPMADATTPVTAETLVEETPLPPLELNAAGELVSPGSDLQ